MLSSVKNWWGAGATPAAAPTDNDEDATHLANKKNLSEQETEPGVDVDANISGKETGQQKDPSKELLHAAKDIGSYIYTFGKRATTSVTSKAKQLATAPNIVEEFDRQQKEFASSQSERRARAEAAVPPWVGYENEEQLREQILALSKDTRNFLRSPPQGASFSFDLESCSPVAMATLEVDDNLRKMRFELVPKRVKEAEFWRNYFYRVSLIRQSSQLSALARSNAAFSGSASAVAAAANAGGAAAADSASTSSDAGYEKVSPPPSSSSAYLQHQQQLRSSPASSRDSPKAAIPGAADEDDDDNDGADCGDFASSELANQQPAALSSVERQRIGGGTAATAVGSAAGGEDADDWEGELQRELKEFELVNSEQTKSAAAASPGGEEDDELEREIMAQLASEGN
ncbi:hypothetical protein BOX15_Mlig032337g1 [Macrostomum lignano]|uniref:BSD domain-containing protein n=2 Tax=Macrostomum lignano TaxID=282301 RepID=A0A1I8IGX8_9PLAT|nr:hypothetical protein BOX15_Mlig032337g1 [Macrostomum lignano]